MRKKILSILIITFCIIMLKYTDSLASTTSIPKVYFEGNMSDMTAEDEREIVVKYGVLTKYAKIKILQDSASLAYEKTNYTINFYENETYTNEWEVDLGFGWGMQSEYCINANWVDKTHSRNIVTARIAAKLQEKYNVFSDTPHNGTTDGFPIEIYLNGEFLGLYTCTIPKNAWMWNMDENNENHIVIGGEDWTDSTGFHEEVTNSLEESGWKCEVGTENEETISKLNRLINFVKNSSDEEFINDFDKYLNKNAALNYALMMYLANGADNVAKNLMLVTYDGNIWYPSLYDLDTTFGTNWHGMSELDYEWTPDTCGSALWRRILWCFPNEIANRWFELRKDMFTKDSIMSEFNNFINNIPAETYQKEALKWTNSLGYGREQIEEFLDFRLPYIDNVMYEKYTFNPNISIQYSTQENTNQNVIATLISDRNDVVVIKDGKETNDFTYTFEKNGTYTFQIQDFKGNNKQEVVATVDWIDKDPPIITIKYETKTNGNVLLTIKSNEELKEKDGWTLSSDKKQMTKEFSENMTKDEIFEDLLGNKQTVTLEIDDIKSTTTENDNQKEDTTIADVILPHAGTIQGKILIAIGLFIVLSIVFVRAHKKIVLK